MDCGRSMEEMGGWENPVVSGVMYAGGKVLDDDMGTGGGGRVGGPP